jgi:methyl-accepting chemotaxis protein
MDMDIYYITLNRSQFKARLWGISLLSLLTGLWIATILACVVSGSFLSRFFPWFQILFFVLLLLLWIRLARSFKHISRNPAMDGSHSQGEFAQVSDSAEDKNRSVLKELNDLAACRHEKLTGTLRELHVLVTNHLNSVTSETNDAALNLIDQLKFIHESMEHLLTKVAENRKASDQMASGSQSTLVDNQDTMDRLQTYISKRLEEINHDHQMASELQEQAAIMSNLTKSVESIAKQTTIVATNAKIEASRAGVHGKAFGIIADEVTNLSAQIGDSSKQIIHSIDQMGKSIEEKFKLKLDKEAKTEESDLLSKLKDQLVAIGKSYSQLESFNSETLADINSSSEHIKSKVNDSIMAIQFQDFTQQQIEVILKSLRLFDDYLSDRSCFDFVNMENPDYKEFDIEKIRKLYVMKKQHDIHNKQCQIKRLGPNQQKEEDTSDITLF